MLLKGNEYLRKIISSEYNGNSFNIFSANSKNKMAGGQINSTGEAYLLNSKKNADEIGLRIDNGKYLFIWKQRKFVDHPYFEDIVKNDPNMTEEEFKNTFGDVFFMEVYESDKPGNLATKVEYLVNGSSFLLLDAFQINSNYGSIACTLDSKVLNSEYLMKFRLNKPYFQNLTQEKIDNAVIDLESSRIKEYIVQENNKPVNDLKNNILLVSTIYYEILATEVESKGISSKTNYCFNIIKENLSKKYEGFSDCR